MKATEVNMYGKENRYFKDVPQRAFNSCTGFCSVCCVFVSDAAGGTRERPWSAILSPEDHSSLMIPPPRRHTSIMPFHGNNLSKSLSISNIAGWVCVGLLLILSFSHKLLLLIGVKITIISVISAVMCYKKKEKKHLYINLYCYLPFSVRCLMRCPLKAYGISLSRLTPSTETTRSQSPWNHSLMKVIKHTDTDTCTQNHENNE